jgi:hypothetical protein
VDHVPATWQVSIRRAGRALPVDRSTYHYRSRRTEQAELTAPIKEIAATRVRYGYRRIHLLLRREGWHVTPKRVYRLYREMGPQLRDKVSKRRVKAKLRQDRQPAMQANETWAMDFVMTSWQQDESCGSSRSSTPSLDSRRRSNPGSPSAAPMSRSFNGQGLSAPPERCTLEKLRQPGPRMGSSSRTVSLQSVLDKSWGQLTCH